MSDDPAWPSDVRELQELFVDVTGERTFTDAQNEDTGRGVVHTTGDRNLSRPEDVETDPDDAREVAVGARPGTLDDAIGSQRNGPGR